MASNIIEHIRAIHGEVNLDRKAIIDDILNPEDKHKKQITQIHKIKSRIDRIYENEKNLLKLYQDTSEALKDTEKSISSKNNLGVFYAKINDILSQKKLINEIKKKDDTSAESLNLNLNFSGEEFYGKYVEMNVLYQEFLNIKGMPSMYLNGIKKIDYKLFLEIFDHFHNISQSAKTSKKYFRYCSRVLAYLEDFYAKKFPLYPIDQIVREIRDDFAGKWAAGSIAGWQKEWPADIFQKYPSKSTVSLKERMELMEAKPADEKNKETNFCTVCGKEFKKTVWNTHMKGKRHQRNLQLFEKKSRSKKGEEACDSYEKGKSEDQKRETAYFEFAIKIFKTLLADVFEETCYYIEKKLTRSYAEIRKELEQREKEEEEEEDVFDDDHEGKDKSLWNGGVYNPKKIPLGWDGRPIPYWLYKFHGLNIGYKCEICGGTKYYGPRAFQQHFKEWKHANGMKALGLPNTKHFHNVTKIDEAEALYRKLKEKKIMEMFNPQLEEEFEDNEGNVYGKQTYEALRRQRVI